MTDGKKHTREEILWGWAAQQLSAIRWQDTGSVHFLANFIDPRVEVTMKLWIPHPGQRSTREDVTAPLVADVCNKYIAGCEPKSSIESVDDSSQENKKVVAPSRHLLAHRSIARRCLHPVQERVRPLQAETDEPKTVPQGGCRIALR